MSGLHTVYRDQGAQTLVHVPARAVASATYVIEDLSVGETDPDRIIAQGSATVDTLSETTTAIAGPRASIPRRLPLVATAALAGRTYRLISATDGTHEPVRLEAVTATSATVAGRLASTYPTGSTLQGAEIRATFPDQDTDRWGYLQEEDRVLRVVWTYSIGGELCRPAEQIRVIRHGGEFEAWMTLAETLLRTEWPELCEGFGGGADSIRSLINACARDVVASLRAMSVEPADLFLGDQGFELLMRRCVYRFGELGHSPKGRELETWVAQQRTHYFSLFKAIAKGGGARTAVVEPTSDVATHNSRPRRRYLMRPM